MDNTGWMDAFSPLTLAAWFFFAIAVTCGVLLTSLKPSTIRVYRRVLITTLGTTFLLGLGALVLPRALPIFFRTPVSALVPTADLTVSQKISLPFAPIKDARTALAPEQDTALRTGGFQFVYKQNPEDGIERVLAVTALKSQPQRARLALLTPAGDLLIYDAYSGASLVRIPLKTRFVTLAITEGDRLYLAAEGRTQSRIIAIDLAGLAVVWERKFKWTKWQDMQFHPDLQILSLVSRSGGLWTLSATNGEIFWVRPELPTLAPVTRLDGNWVVTEAITQGGTEGRRVLSIHPQTGRTLLVLAEPKRTPADERDTDLRRIRGLARHPSWVYRKSKTGFEVYDDVYQERVWTKPRDGATMDFVAATPDAVVLSWIGRAGSGSSSEANAPPASAVLPVQWTAYAPLTGHELWSAEFSHAPQLLSPVPGLWVVRNGVTGEWAWVTQNQGKIVRRWNFPGDVTQAFVLGKWWFVANGASFWVMQE